ncbi:NAD-dependent epimerase/dehydratase family protein [Streptomyces sp. NPDC052042]|uniref:NAD-dependent epimerase/dehydratase family protein n=1 Tax=Streptomyces sp. NPDC052042 TaxID=3365683 RepID=UPI0037D75D11
MRIIVLGHSGYLGGHAAEQLGAVPGVRLVGGGRTPASDFEADLATVGTAELAERIAAFAPDAVVNCAGAVGGDAVTLAEVNARGPAVLCAALREAAPGARLVHLGSAAEYGPTARGERVTEYAATRPAGLYGATKLAGTIAVTTSGLDAVVLRVTNPVGPGAPAAGLPGGLARQLRRAGTGPDAVVRLGDLSACRDFVDARDVAHAVVLAVTAPGPLPGVLNIGSGHAVPVRELVHGFTDVTGFRGSVREAADRSGGSTRSAQVSWQCSDPAAARATLGWAPRHSLRESLTALWAATAPGQPEDRIR